MEITIPVKKKRGMSEITVDAQIVGTLAYHVAINNAHHWTVTHVPTGRLLASVQNEVQAKWFCDVAAPLVDGILTTDPDVFAQMVSNSRDGMRFIALCRLIHDLWNAIPEDDAD